MARSKHGSGAAPRSARTVWPPERKRVAAILRGLDRLYPEADCELHRDNPFQLLCATILSAQCTDERVNQVTPLLFAQFPTPAAMAMAPPPALEELIHSTGFFRNKAKNLIGASRAIVERHGGQVPHTMAELCELPGVARKTANVVLGTAFGLAEGIVVDTHVQRLAQRLALTRFLDARKDRAGSDDDHPARMVDPVFPSCDLARPPLLFRAPAGLRTLSPGSELPECVQRGIAE
jgi:endonuclease-3